ncbi:MAG: bifunctional glycosyltransferase family 2/GtrA family protein [Butyrivibrio sp.]|jgi:glycosyltransferase involved in cell wall biosynthesis|nr:bifunctional glycosyltransferase family 2/GtrA family protein [Butyrivibrio sp.]
MAEIPVIIPSYEPDERMTELMEHLKAAQIAPVVIVDDGSEGEAYQEIFRKAQTQFGYTVLHHAVNLGKGRALKTAFNYCLNTWPDMVGCVTIDSDGQHTVKDMCACMEALRRNPEALIMGVRDFGAEGIPARSVFGNRCTSVILKALTGVSVSDTQTGLRAIPAAFMKRLLHEKGERFELETNMLIDTKEEEIPIIEVPIDTIYLAENKSSHFNPLKDSIRIYAVFGKFLISSFSSSLVDLLLFTMFCHLTRKTDFGIMDYIMASTIFARVLSATYNFLINYRVVFKSKKNTSGAVVRYIMLAVCIMLASGFLVGRLHGLTSLPEVVVKIPVDCLLFLLSFFVQREYVYR